MEVKNKQMRNNSHQESSSLTKTSAKNHFGTEMSQVPPTDFLDQSPKAHGCRTQATSQLRAAMLYEGLSSSILIGDEELKERFSKEIHTCKRTLAERVAEQNSHASIGWECCKESPGRVPKESPNHIASHPSLLPTLPSALPGLQHFYHPNVQTG